MNQTVLDSRYIEVRLQFLVLFVSSILFNSVVFPLTNALLMLNKFDFENTLEQWLIPKRTHFEQTAINFSSSFNCNVIIRMHSIPFRLSINYLAAFKAASLNRPFSYSPKEPGSSVIFIHFIQDVGLSGARASITIVLVRKYFKVHQNIIRFRFFLRVAKRSIAEIILDAEGD